MSARVGKGCQKFFVIKKLRFTPIGASLKQQSAFVTSYRNFAKLSHAVKQLEFFFITVLCQIVGIVYRTMMKNILVSLRL